MAFNIGEWFSSFISSTQRILIVSKKPDTAKFMNMARITAIGLVILGALGYAIELITFFIRNAV
ncbi:MAG: protein translocase SEC61 complex subunit gamma [Candidatus Diapherotrites archaeon]